MFDTVPRALANSGEIGGGQWLRRLISRFQQPRLQFGSDFKGTYALVAEGAEHVIDEVADIRTDTFAQLLLEKVFDVLRQGDLHVKRRVDRNRLRFNSDKKL